MKKIFLFFWILLTISVAAEFTTDRESNKKIIEKIKKSQESLDSFYTKDNKTIYYEWTPLGNADLETFEVLGNGFAKDKNDIYHHGVGLNVDMETFEYSITGTCFRGKDKNSDYEYGCGEIRRK